jgi:hypothetical protein
MRKLVLIVTLMVSVGLVGGVFAEPASAFFFKAGGPFGFFGCAWLLWVPGLPFEEGQSQGQSLNEGNYAEGREKKDEIGTQGSEKEFKPIIDLTVSRG